MGLPAIELSTLPTNHTLRNTPLKQLNPTTKLRHHKETPKPCAHWKIGKATYNELDTFWHQCREFFVEQKT